MRLAKEVLTAINRFGLVVEVQSVRNQKHDAYEDVVSTPVHRQRVKALRESRNLRLGSEVVKTSIVFLISCASLDYELYPSDKIAYQDMIYDIKELNTIALGEPLYYEVMI
jgi:hypothetical protein